MHIIGLTGGIACGKSNISEELRQLGAVIIDGDVLSRELTAPGGRALSSLRKAFGNGIFCPDGTLDRRTLGSIVFADANQRALLDGIMQPLLREMILEGIERARAGGAMACVLDMPLLYEKELDGLCDVVWCAYIPREMQLQRLMARDGFTREEAESRLASQLPADEKAAMADVVIDTSGPIQYTKAMIPELYAHEIGKG
ncbi:MAG: dephospho-CoA kinase [Clostridia bacterium]|nr:dephospho-CoA kinase [Clostridia bacterium]